MSDDKARPTPEMLVAGLIHLLDVKPIGDALFQGARKPGGVGRVFGGQVIGQALAAAMKTVGPDKQVHSLHAYFMRGGDEDYAIDFRVEADFDGRSFANRRVVAIQKGLPILNLVSSFQRREEGLHHQAVMPDAPPPEDLEDQADYARRHRAEIPEPVYRLMTRTGPIEIRPVGLHRLLRQEKGAPFQAMWFRVRAPLPADQNLHRAILALSTDFGLLGTSFLPHGVNWISHDIQTASLDHALWFHEDVKVDDWLLYAMDSPWTGHARGFNRGSIYTREGRLVASATQEGLMRLRGV